ncbi:MAG: hypothetical protein HWN66_18220 [Candidatus Helarchaeota archaeon]|nr:hypothetical protein [Candidatus Helarchaeota archaeon]
MNQKGVSDLNNLLEGITTKIGEFTKAIKGSSKQLDTFSESIDKKVISLNENIASLTDVIKEEDKHLTKNLRDVFAEVKGEIQNFKEEVKISDIKEILASLQKVVKTPEKTVINKTVEKVIKEIFEIAKEIKGEL